jgi:cell division transport system permease protein
LILDRIWVPGPDARLLPAEKLHAPTVAVMAIMTFAMMIVAAAGLSLANAAASVTSGIESKLVLQLPSAVSSDLPKAVAAARGVKGVHSVTPVPEQEMRRTLERWLGDAASSDDLPLPGLATVEVAPEADPVAIAAALRKAVPQASVTAETAELKPLLSSIHGLQWLALSLVLLMAAATAAAVVLAARGALDTHRPTVEIMHGIGATDAQVTKLFERKIAVDAIAGALAGALAAVLVLLVVGGGIAAAAGAFGASAPLSLLDLLLLALLPAAAVFLAVAVAHRTLLGALRANL